MGIVQGNATGLPANQSLVERVRYDALKRMVDMVGSVLLIFVLSPVFLLTVVLVLSIEGTPVIYRRRVVGRDGEFDAFKFRTMHRDADRRLEQDEHLRQAFHENFKLKCDPRVTRLGALLRKFSLDELPQLFNVLMGQMTLVGPRMITAPELEKYGEHQYELRKVKPGLTGYWQVYGRQDVSYAERVRMDLEYIRNRSLWMDFKLLGLTPIRVIRGRGAY
jgi:lipopolysaccharide/colanic/teichoic acid biosynthesis glycosyltransferase